MAVIEPPSTPPAAGGDAPARAHARALLTLGLPLAGGHLAQHGMHLVDTIMLGWYDVTALAGLTIAVGLLFFVFVLGLGFAWAVMPLAAEAAETGDRDALRRVTQTGFWLSAISGLVLMLPMVFSGPLYVALGQTPAVAEEATRYSVIVAFGIVPGLIFMTFASYFGALERTRVVFWVTLWTAIANGVLNYALIFGRLGAPEMGIAGAAIGSVAVHWAGIVWLAIHAHRATPETALFSGLFRPHGPTWARVFRLGWPIGLSSLSEVGLFAGAAVLIGMIGEIPLAAHGIALQICTMTFVVHLGLSQAATIRVGRALGRGDMAGLRRGSIVAMAMSIGLACVYAVIFVTVPGVLVGLFVDPADPARPEILQVGVTLMLLAALFQITDGAQVMAMGLLRGIQDTRVPAYIAALSYWGVGLVAAWALGLPLGLGAAGVWIGFTAGLLAAAVLLNLRYWRYLSRIAG